MRKISMTAPLIGISLAILSMSGMIDSAAHASTEGEKPLSSAELQARSERIREYFKDRLRRMEVIETTVTESGQKIDWIVPESQTTDRTLAEPPAWFESTKVPDLGTNLEPKESQPKVPLEQLALTEVQVQPSARGPDGTVPVVRFDVERYLANVKIPPEDPRDLLKKLPIQGLYT